MPQPRWLVLALALSAAAAAPSSGQEVRSQLKHLVAAHAWAEARLADGSVVTIRVDSLWADSVAVHQVVGPLQERRALLAVAGLQAVHEVGPLRIPQAESRAPARKSLATALALETVLPGAGYLYAGEPRTGLPLLGTAGALAVTAVLTGRNGAAAWVPLAAWIEVASLLNLRDEVRAMDGAPNRQRGTGEVPHPASGGGRGHGNLRLGIGCCPQARGPALRVGISIP